MSTDCKKKSENSLFPLINKLFLAILLAEDNELHPNTHQKSISFSKEVGWDFTGKENSFYFIFLLMKEVNLYGFTEKFSLLGWKIFNSCSCVEII